MKVIVSGHSFRSSVLGLQSQALPTPSIGTAQCRKGSSRIPAIC